MPRKDRDMSQVFKKANMVVGSVYRLKKTANTDRAKSYIGKLFLGASTTSGSGGSKGIKYAVCLEDGMAFDGLLDYSEFEEASAKIVDLD